MPSKITRAIAALILILALSAPIFAHAGEHALTQQYATLLGGTAICRDGVESGPYPRPRFDYIQMPSGFVVPTDSVVYNSHWGLDAVFAAVAYGEEWALDHDGLFADVPNGTTGKITKPSPQLLRYYAHPEKWQEKSLL